MIGFLEESEGVRSIARLTIAWMCALATVVIATTCYCVIVGKLDAAGICAMGGLLLTIATKTIVALLNRNNPADDTK